MKELREDIVEPELKYIFDEDTRFIDDKPLIVFGEIYTGIVEVTNPTKYQYLVIAMGAVDKDMQLEQPPKFIMPGESIKLKFRIATEVKRIKPFVLQTDIHGGYMI